MHFKDTGLLPRSQGLVVKTRDGRILLRHENSPFKTIGKIQREVLTVSRNPERHVLRDLGAYCFACSLLWDGGFRLLRVRETGGGLLEITRERALQFGRVVQFGGFEAQFAVPRSAFREVIASKGPLALPAHPIAEQLSLFQEARHAMV